MYDVIFHRKINFELLISKKNKNSKTCYQDFVMVEELEETEIRLNLETVQNDSQKNLIPFGIIHRRKSENQKQK